MWKGLGGAYQGAQLGDGIPKISLKTTGEGHQMEQAGHVGPGCGSELSGAFCHQSEADLESLPSLPAFSTCLALRPWWETQGWGVCWGVSAAEARELLCSQPWSLVPSTHLVWGGHGAQEVTPRRPPRCRSSPSGLSVCAGLAHWRKKGPWVLSPGSPLTQRCPRRG